MEIIHHLSLNYKFFNFFSNFGVVRINVQLDRLVKAQAEYTHDRMRIDYAVVFYNFTICFKAGHCRGESFDFFRSVQ